MAGERALTRTGDVVGTLAYMAPEQSEGRKAVEATDLYALALVLYEAVSGSNPVRGPTPAATVRRIGQPIAPLERTRGDLPRTLSRALEQALAPSPADRGTLEHLRRGLGAALGAVEPVGVEHSEGAFAERAGTRRRFARRAEADELHGRELERLTARDAAGSLPEAPSWQAHPAGQAPAAEARRSRRERPAEATAAWRSPAGAPAAVAELGHAPATHEPQERAARRLSIPRRVWLGCGAAAVIWEAASSRAGVALLLAAAIAPLAALPRRSGGGFLACALAPALGVRGLAGAFPALAGQARAWRVRVAYGALGYWWLVLAEPLLARRLWLGAPAGAPARAVWEHSLTSAGAHVVGPLLTAGVLLGAGLWGAAAIALPWIVRGRSAAIDAVAATVWSAAVVSAAPILDRGLHSGATHASPRGAVLGAVLGGLIAIAARALRGPV